MKQGFTIVGDSDTIFIPFSTTDDFLVSYESEDITTGGMITAQQSGSRYVVVEKDIRLTGSEYKDLMDLLADGSSFYTYEPETIPSFLSPSEFPMEVQIATPKKKSQAWGGSEKKVFIVDLEIKQVRYR
jgi:hypothetical protein